MQPVSLAFFWHQHQPYYSDDISGDTLMPWVRLHGTKDYYGMALHVKEVPEFHCTINLVPSLLVQLMAYTEHGRTDRHLDISRAPADGLSQSDACYLLDNFFMANFENMIRPYQRYAELYHKRGDQTEPAVDAMRRFSEADIRDLQVWNNLTWIHPLAFAQDSDLQAFLDKGERWTEAEKNWLLDKQLDILRAVIPLHRELSEGGQVELTTTPFYHPILPLLWDKKSAREAMPGCPLPQNLESYAADAKKQLNMAVEFHAELFGSAPTGLWPSEGSVSQAIVGAIADTGVEWIATDEEILAESTNGWVSRDYQGHMRHPEMLFRPWYCEDDGRKLQVVFRDHALSDLIGFHYQRSNPEHAANDLIGRAEGIGRAVSSSNKDRPALVPVILDGENCWEYYPDGGVKFLRTLYQQCAQHSAIRPVRMIDHLREYPATDRIGHLFAGSWISHNFAIWIGHEEDRTAWDRLHETREFLVRAEENGRGTEEARQRAWEEIHIAEGSDWYWWFGDDHNSAQDELFDQLFRRHLINVYTLLEADCPPILNQPISHAEHRAVHTQPTSFLKVKVDGRASFFEWINAGRYETGSQRGTMTLVTSGLIKKIQFGFDTDSMMLRLDTENLAADDLRDIEALQLRFLDPPHIEVRVSGLSGGQLWAKLIRDGEGIVEHCVEVAMNDIVEMKIPFASLGVQANDSIRFCVEAISDTQSIDRAPQEGLIEFKVPTADFENINWQA